MNSKAIQRAKKAATGWFHLSGAEEKARSYRPRRLQIDKIPRPANFHRWEGHAIQALA